MPNSNNLIESFHSLRIDESWTFENLKPRDTTYLTHSYHRYPTKFIPQLVNRIINENSKKHELICDPFVGCGTTLLEGLLTQRYTIGLDINPVAQLISATKITPIQPQELQRSIRRFFTKLNTQNGDSNCFPNQIEKIKFWFDEKTTKELSNILSVINEIEDEKIRNFFKCAFSHILKNCSKWNMDSLKPIRAINKKIPNPTKILKRHINYMKKRNNELYNILPEKIRKNIEKYVLVYCQDCREIPAENEQISLIVTSPPYVTSYEYIDLYQLSLLWLYPQINMTELRKKFIGTQQPKEINKDKIESEIVNQTINEFENKIKEAKNNNIYLKNCKKAVFTYFAEMQEAIQEFHRLLKPNGTLSITIGNTTLGGIQIHNAEALTEIAINTGFKLKKVIKRRIPSGRKWLPTMRDPQTGQFASNKKRNQKPAYPHEYIVFLKKS